MDRETQIYAGGAVKAKFEWPQDRLDEPCKPAVSLVENGQWMVPPEQRPKGWEAMNIAPRKAEPIPLTKFAKRKQVWCA